MNGLDHFADLEDEDEDDGIDYSDYNKELASQIDERIENEDWLTNPKQPYYVVETAERTLTMSQPDEISKRRRIAQEQVAAEVAAQDVETIQKACHTRLFQDRERPQVSLHGQKQWHILFDNVLESIETHHRSDFPR